MNAGNVAYDKIIRRYYIQTIFMNQDENPGVGLFNIIAEYLSNKENSTEISMAIDAFIKLRLRPPPALIKDAEEAREKAEIDARARGPQSYGQGSTATLGSLGYHLGRGPIPSSDQSHMFGNVDTKLREDILHIEKENPGVILDLNDSATRFAVFNRLNETGPIYSPEVVMNEIDRLLKERKLLPSPVTFLPGNFTPEELQQRDEAGKSGWRPGMGPFEKPYFFRKPGGDAAEEGGGNKRIKSKKNSKRRYKKSKKRSNRRRRRYSYKK